MASTTSTRTKTPTRPTVTDEEYKVLLANRLAAGKAFEQGEVTHEQYLETRRQVRNARKTRKAEAEVIQTWNAFQEDKKLRRSQSRQAKRQAAQVA